VILESHGSRNSQASNSLTIQTFTNEKPYYLHKIRSHVEKETWKFQRVKKLEILTNISFPWHGIGK